MTSPIVEINADGLYLSLERGSLIISKSGQILGTMPFDGITALLLTSPASTVTQQVLIRFAEENIPVIVCGKNYLPIGIYASCFQHSDIKSRIELQIQATEPHKKRLWQKIVKEKIRAQKLALEKIQIPADDFNVLIDRVKSGDPENIEAVAARKYWTKLFGEDFLRSDENNITNTFLNYGYAVLRACVARWVVAHGLNPSLSIFHQNYKNAFVLVDDLMEPFRPFVDQIVKIMMTQEGEILEIKPEHKRQLISVIELPVKIAGESTILNNALQTFVYSYCHSLTSGTVDLKIPDAI